MLASYVQSDLKERLKSKRGEGEGRLGKSRAVLNCSGNDTIFKINPEWKMEVALRHDSLFYSSVSVSSLPERQIH